MEEYIEIKGLDFVKVLFERCQFNKLKHLVDEYKDIENQSKTIYRSYYDKMNDFILLLERFITDDKANNSLTIKSVFNTYTFDLNAINLCEDKIVEFLNQIIFKYPLSTLDDVFIFSKEQDNLEFWYTLSVEEEIKLIDLIIALGIAVNLFCIEETYSLMFRLGVTKDIYRNHKDKFYFQVHNSLIREEGKERY